MANDLSSLAFLGIEGGGTKTVAVYEHVGSHRRLEVGPGNLRLLNDGQLEALFTAARQVHDGLPTPAAIAIGMASARLETDRARIRGFAEKVWPGIPCYACDDLQPALAAAEMEARELRQAEFKALVITLAGTGSCFFGRNVDGKTAKVGGWGHLLGDDGSAYWIGMQAMRAAVWEYDRDNEVPRLGQRLLRTLLLNKPEEMSAWAVSATKSQVGALAREVAVAAEEGDSSAQRILRAAAESIATEAAACARKLVPKNTPVRFAFTGSVLLKNQLVAKTATARLKQLWPRATVAPLNTEGARGAVELAKAHFSTTGSPVAATANVATSKRAPQGARALLPQLDLNLAASPTEQRNPRSMKLDQLSVAEAIELMLSEDQKIPAAIRHESATIERVVGWIVRAFKSGGRLFYIGAGTSGRLGVLDASECPPTFRSDPELVQGIIAGGYTALWSAVEGAEDSPDEGMKAIQSRGITEKDVLVGIAASGRTPFVWGALMEARERGAKTVLLTFNPSLNMPRALRPSAVIAPNVGPEILTGSTRLKSGTATKLVLNIFTTLAMVRTGKVLSNLMVDVKPSNAKLRDRAIRIVSTITGVDAQASQSALEACGWVIKPAVQRLQRRKRP